MYKYDLILQEGHPLIQSAEQTLVLDTGNPMSFANNQKISFADKNFPCSQGLMGVNADYLSEQLGCEVHGIIGNDILKDYCIKFDYANKSVTFSQNSIDPPAGATSVPIELIMDVPSIQVQVAGQAVKCFIDTGAKLGYMPQELCQGCKELAAVSDFFPIVGEFQTKRYEMDSTIGDQSFSGTYGNLPGILNLSLSMVDIEGIVGYDFFTRFCVILDQPNNMLHITPNN